MRRIIAYFLIVLITISILYSFNSIIVSKATNRYYMLNEEIKKQKKLFDVIVIGSCHAYTSFNPTILNEKYGISAYNMSNPSEIIPVSYLQMEKSIKTNIPKVIMLEAWGINLFDTYLNGSLILDSNKRDLELLPLSINKIDILDELDISPLNSIFLITEYKDRILNLDLNQVDFNYSYERNKKTNMTADNKWVFDDMDIRFSNYGYLSYEPNSVLNYSSLQATVSKQDKLEPEPFIVEYLDMIVELCNKYGIELIMYRAPYISSEQELKRFNWLRDYSEKKGISYFDLEEEIQFDYQNDFHDLYHLSKTGSIKVTEFLNKEIVRLINQNQF